jgi:hypothetical protein
MPTLTKAEIKKLGYWKLFVALLGPNPQGEGDNEDEFDLSDETMEILRGKKPLPSHCGPERPLPRWVHLPENSEVYQDGNDGVVSGVAQHVSADHGPLIADAPRMLEALRLLSREALGDWVYDVRDNASESGDGWAGDRWDHPRVKSWSKACELTAELVKKHENFGK